MPSRQVPASVSAQLIVRDQVRVVMDRHALTADHPASMGGDDLGPAPVHLVLGALAACKAVTVARYARRKGYPIESITVRIPTFEIAYDRIEGPVHSVSAVSRVEAAIEVEGRLTDGQLRELEEVARTCPVSETLIRGVRIDQRLVHTHAQAS